MWRNDSRFHWNGQISAINRGRNNVYDLLKAIDGN